MSQIPSLVIDYKFVSVNNEFHNITWSGTINVLVLVSTLFKQTLRYDWLLHVSGASPRIWTCDTRPLLLAWARWGLGTRLGYALLHVQGHIIAPSLYMHVSVCHHVM